MKRGAPSFPTRGLLACCVLWSASTFGAALDPVERAIVAEVDRRQPEALDLLQRAVIVNSGTLNRAGVRRVGALFGDALAALGFDVGWVDGADFQRAGHLVARHGVGSPHLLLIGHLDTVFEPDSPFQDFQRLDDGRARGPGVIDMKGGDVIIVEALAALHAAGVLDDLRVTVVLTGDEEAPGSPLARARRTLIDVAREADVALGFEDGDGNPATAVVSRRGFTGWELTVHGRPAHSSLIFSDDVGVGAIYETARILDGFRTELAGERYLTFNPGLVLGGTSVDYDAAQSKGEAFGKPNVIAERAVVKGDLRTLSADQLASARDRMTAVVGRHLPGTTAEITFEDGYPPLAPTDGNRRLLTLYDRASRDLGFGPVTAVNPAEAGAADVSFTAGHVDMAMDGLGLMGEGGHTVGETADLATLASQTKRAAVLMYRLSQGGMD